MVEWLPKVSGIIMDRKRLALYALLGIFCFALWGEWQKDYPGDTLSHQLQLITGSETTNDQSTGRSTSGNLGVATTVATSPAVVAAVSIPAARLIKVHTDVLDVVIDTLGGKVVQAKLLKYPLKLEKPVPVQLFDDQPEHFYLAESGLIGPFGPDRDNSPAQYVTAQKEFTLHPDQQELQVKLLWHNKSNSHVAVVKTFTFVRGHYDIKLNYEVDNKSRQDWNGQFYAQFKRKNVPEVETSKLQYGTFVGASISSPAKLYEKFDYKKLAKEDLSREIHGGWLAFQQRYFLGAWIPEQNQTYTYFSNVIPDEIYTLGFKSGNLVVPAGAKTSINATLYAGPEVASILKNIAPGLELTIDYGWLWVISAFLFWVLQQVHRVVSNWGWAIIIVTILIKAVFFRLSESSYRSMAKMKDLAPKLQQLKDRYGDDRQRLSQATMELYKKEKVNPLGGCLPMLIQIPVFIGLYYVLIEAIELRHAPFIFWIQDLSAKDPYYILPVLMGVSMFVQQLLSPQSPDPMQAKMMMALPVVFTVFFLSFPSGLVLYWLVNNCLSIVQQWYINKKHSSLMLSSPSSTASVFASLVSKCSKPKRKESKNKH